MISGMSDDEGATRKAIEIRNMNLAISPIRFIKESDFANGER